MIAHIKVIKNAKEITEVNEFNAVISAKQNDPHAKPNKAEVQRLEAEKKPAPEKEFQLNEMSLIETDITLAYVNTLGEISIQYQGQSFVLEYEDDVWKQIKAAMQIVSEKKISDLKCK